MDTYSQKEVVVKSFDERAATYYNAYFGNTTKSHSFRIRRERVYELIDNNKPGKILDIGCGPGIMVNYFVGKGFEYYGVDISQRVIEVCKEKFKNLEKSHFSTGEIEKLKYSNSFFDLIVCMGVVEYIEDDRVALEEMLRVLKPGGTIIITLPNMLSPYRIWSRTVYRFITAVVKRIIGRKRAAIVQREYTEKDYSRLLASYQLNVIDVMYYNFMLLFPPFDKLFSRISVFTSKKLEFLYRSRFKWLATGFIIKAEKL